MDEIEKVEYKDYIIKIVSDDYPEDPRYFQDNFGTMCCWYRDYFLGDYKKVDKKPDKHMYKLMENWYDTEIVEKWYNEMGFTEFIEFCIDKLSEHAIVFPLTLLDHSGITMKIGNSFSCDPGGEDTSRVGFIFVTFEDIKKEFGIKKLTKKYKEKAERILRAEVEEYDRYLTGEVYGLQIFNEDEEEIESCYGYYDEVKNIIEDGKYQIDSIIKYEEKKKEFQMNNFNIAWVMA